MQKHIWKNALKILIESEIAALMTEFFFKSINPAIQCSLHNFSKHTCRFNEITKAEKEKDSAKLNDTSK